MKKILSIFMLLIAVAGAYAEDSYFLKMPDSASVEASFTIFNFIAAIFQNEHYIHLLKLVVLISGAFVFFAGIIKSHGGQAHSPITSFVGYLVGMTAILSMVYSSKTNLVIDTDNISSVYYTKSGSSTISSSSTGEVVANIPSLYAYGLNAFNEIGSGISRFFQMGFSTSNSYNNMSYTKDMHDAMSILNVNFENLNAPASMVLKSFFEDCIIIPASNSDTDKLLINDLLKSNNVVEFVNNNMLTPVNGIPLQNHLVSVAGGATYTCDDLWRNQILATYLPSIHQEIPNNFYDIGGGALQLIVGQNNVASSNFDEVIIQAGITNMLSKSSANLVNGTDMTYANGKTTAQFIQEGVGAGIYMSEKLPLVATLFRLLLYAMFPLIFVMTLVPGGTAILKNYGKALLWVEMWIPMTVILNFFISLYTESEVVKLSEGTITAYTNQMILHEIGTYAGIAGFLLLMVPSLTWSIMNGSFEHMSGAIGNISARFSSNLSTDAVAKDMSKLTQQQLQSAERGKIVSMAEMSSLQHNQNASHLAGSLEGFNNIGTYSNYKQSKFDTEVKNSTWQERVNTSGSIENLKQLENFNAGSGTTEQLAFKNAVGGSYNPSGAGGTLKGIDANANENKLNEFGAPLIQDTANKKSINTQAGDIGLHLTTNQDDHLKKGQGDGQDVKANAKLQDNNLPEKLEDVKNYNAQKPITTTAKEIEVFGANGAIDPLKTVENLTERDRTSEKGTLDKQLINVPNSTPASIGNIVATTNTNDFLQKKGSADVTTPSQNEKKGNVDGLDIKTTANNADKHGLNKIESNLQNNKNETTITDDTRFKTLDKELPNGKDTYFEQKSASNVKTQELPQTFSGDLDGDKNITDKEMKFQQHINDLDAKKNVIMKSFEQDTDKAMTDKLDKDKTLNKDLRKALDAPKKKTSIEELQKLTGSNAVKTKADKQNQIFNGRKDYETSTTLEGSNNNPEKSGLVAAGDEIKKVSKSLEEVKTGKDVIENQFSQAVNQIKDSVRNRIEKAYPNMDINQREALISKQTMNALSNVGLASADVTKDSLNRELDVARKTAQRKIASGMSKQFNAKEMGTLTVYNHMRDLKENALKTGNKAQAAALEKQMNKFESTNDFKNIKSKERAYLNSGSVKKINQEFNSQKSKIISTYESAGLVKKDGKGNLSFASSGNMDNLNQKQLMVQVNRTIGKQLGHKLETVSPLGREEKVVKDFQGKNVTRTSTAERSYKNVGGHTNDITYNVDKNGWVKPENIATTMTSYGAVKEAVTVANSLRR